MTEEKKASRRDYLKTAGGFVAGAVVASAAWGAYEVSKPPPAPPPGGQVTVTTTITKTEAGPAVPGAKVWMPQGKIWVPILNKFMTYDEIVEEIKREGKVTIANWTYWGLVDTYFVPELKSYVKDRFGVDVEVEILGTQAAKGGFMYQLYAAYAAGLPPPYDLMHIEVNFFDEAKAKDIMEPFLPSQLVPNTQLVDPYFLSFPYGVQFQQHATCNLTVNSKYVDFLKRWTDLADPRLKGKITLWVFTDNGFWAFLCEVCEDLGGNYKNESDMKKAIEWTAKNIHPNVLKYTSDEADLMGNLESEVTWVAGYWCCLAEGYAITKPHLKAPLLAPWMANLPGVYWIPKKCEHPVLAQIAADWEISPEHQFPNIDQWPGTGLNKEKWLMTEEGPIGPAYEQFFPDWAKELGPKGLYEVFPTIEDAKTKVKNLDWLYVMEHQEEWVRMYEALIK